MSESPFPFPRESKAAGRREQRRRVMRRELRRLSPLFAATAFGGLVDALVLAGSGLPFSGLAATICGAGAALAGLAAICGAAR